MNNKQLIRYARQLLNICENCDRCAAGHGVLSERP